jgi:hypothetical protein
MPVNRIPPWSRRIIIAAVVCSLATTVATPSFANYPPPAAVCTKLEKNQIKGNGYELFVCSCASVFQTDDVCAWIVIDNMPIFEAVSSFLPFAANGNVAALGSGRTEREDRSIKTGADVNTATSLWPVQAGNLRNRSVLFASDGNSWFACRDSQWTYNSSASYTLSPTFDWGSACGENRYYTSYSYHQTFFNGTWFGSEGFTSGNVFLPCLACRGAIPEPPDHLPDPPAI